MICRVQENEGANTVDLTANLRSSSLLQLRLLDRDHVIRLLLTQCDICHFNISLLFLFHFLCLFLLHLFFSSFHLFLLFLPLSTIPPRPLPPPPIPPSFPLPTIWCSRHATRHADKHREGQRERS